MGDKTRISWTDKTWNPWRGCHKVSAGCKHCYMFRDQQRYGRDPNTVVRSKTTFNDPLKWRQPAKVFTCSWSDFFIAEADAWRPEAWGIIKRTPHLTYQILTKRPERIRDHLPIDWGDGYPNVWLGVTCEDQGMADKRIPILLTIPAKVHWLSIEPLLGPIDLNKESDLSPMDCSAEWLEYIDWVIVGGESGPGFRPMSTFDARVLLNQCQSAGIPFWFKQTSGTRPGTQPELLGQLYHQFPKVNDAH